MKNPITNTLLLVSVKRLDITNDSAKCINRLLFFFLTILFPALSIGQQAGDLDFTFSTDGIEITDFGSSNDYGTCLAIQTDGKIIVAGYSYSGTTPDFAVVRYNSNGSLDNTFSGDGKQTTDFAAGSDDQAYSIAIQADGKIVVAGYSISGTNINFAIVRYNSDGSLDNSFSGDGKQTSNFGSNSDDWGQSVAIQADGKIILAGYSSNANNNSDFALVRYNIDGVLDTTFNGDGRQTIGIGIGSQDFGYSVSIQTDGKIIMSGGTDNGVTYDFAITRFNTDGSLDNSFSGDGIQTTDFASSQDVGHSHTVQSDGKIVVAGESYNGSNRDFALARYNTDGSLDNSFSGNGMHTTAIASNGDDFGYSVAIQADGKIIVAGESDNGPDGDFALVRYNSDGSLDNSFSGNGIQTTDIGSVNDFGYSVAIQADGNILLAGHSDNGINYDFTIARYNGILVTDILDNGNYDFVSTSAFPNPFHNTTTLKLISTEQINSTLLVYNSIGKIVHTQIISSLETVLNLDLSVGIYSYTISNEREKLNARGKFVIQ